MLNEYDKLKEECHYLRNAVRALASWHGDLSAQYFKSVGEITEPDQMTKERNYYPEHIEEILKQD